ncbi:Rossmann-like domain-containing protein [Thermococcus sp. GR6]|uniref:Rossmann-like domain-containing protein n=1 Tax=Thermococcus sp. GR6 TaxID=1638256 RepID=UPI00142FB79D|nr:DUF364 domain-containing protein [Thermococcus sp. GR6]NJE42055.1 hypothetical protein [Thermococcus sp. GR6]
MLLREIKRKALTLTREDFRLIDFSFALPYTYVLIEGELGKSIGVAMTLSEEVGRYRTSIEEPSLEAFIEKADSLNIIERTLALAAINAVSQYYLDVSEAPNVDVVELLDRSFEKVAVIGNMPPVVRALREKGFDVLVFERNPKLWDRNTLSDALEYWLLPEVDAVIASGSAILNGTLEMMLDRARKAELFVLTGPTAQLLPEFLKGTGVTHLAAMKVIDVDGALTKLKLGSFRGFEAGSRKYIIEVGG